MYNVDHLDRLRSAEIEEVIGWMPAGARILEFGAGAGTQALALAQRGYRVTAIDLAESSLASERVFPIVDYDGRHLPFPDGSFDIVYSSNALEHVRDLSGMHSEIKRVLAADGICLHVLPTHIWRLFQMMSEYPAAVAAIGRLLRHPLSARAWYGAARQSAAALIHPRHGTRGIGLIEFWLFRPAWWRRNFKRHGFRVVADKPMGLFYTGNMVLGPRLSVARRRRLAAHLGSACHLFKLVPDRGADGHAANSASAMASPA